MASSSPWKDIEDTFFQCSICLDQFKEPKLLPCLHRFCKPCLEPIIQDQARTFKCPLCKDVCQIPNDRIDGFKTDFHMKSMLQFIQLQKSFENEEVRECVGCSKKLKVTAYCFKCKGFLCVQCYRFHLTNKMVADHQKNVLALKDVEGKSLTLEKLASLKEAPRCHIHIEDKAQLCCCTCGNIPVCLTCTYGKHKSHDLRDVTEVAKEERKRLEKRLEELILKKDNVFNLTDKIKDVNKELLSIVTETKAKWKTQHEDETRKLKDKAQEHERELKKFKSELDEETQKELLKLKTEMEEKIRQIREEYDRLINIKTKESKNKEDAKRNEIKNRKTKIDGKINKLDLLLNDKNKMIEKQQARKIEEIQKISDFCNQWVEKFNNFSATTSSVIESHNDWTDAQCVPDIRTASEPLAEDVNKDYKGLKSLSDITISDLPTLSIDKVNISENVESIVDVDGIKANGWRINGITGSGTGDIVITGRMSNTRSHSTVINRNGKQVRHNKIDKVEGSALFPLRYCAALSRDKIVSICQSNQIGVYNVRNGSFIKKDIGYLLDDITDAEKYLTFKFMSCVAVDPVHGHIIVGSSRRLLFIFDEELNFTRTLKLPEVIKWARDIVCHKNTLLICDEESKSVYAVDTLTAELYEFPKPDIDDQTCYPLSVCTDKIGFVYILWSSGIFYSSDKRVITQYSQDGQHLLTTKPTEDGARCIATMVTEEGEKLLVATCMSGRMLSYGLIPEE